MATDKTSLTAYTIDLDSRFVTEAPQEVADALAGLDVDGDRKVTDDEAYGAELSAPLAGDIIKIGTAGDLELYDKLLHSAVNARPFARFAGSVQAAKSFGAPTAEVWAVEHQEIFPQDTGVYLYSRLTMVDVRSTNKATELLFCSGESVDDSFYFSVNIPDDLDKGPVTPITIEFNGNRMLLKDLEKSGDTSFLKLKRDLLDTLLVVLADKSLSAYFPDGFSAKTRDYLEALSFQSGVLPQETSQTQSPTNDPDGNLAVAQKRVYSNQNPVVAAIKLAGIAKNYDVGIRGGNAQKPLTDAEIARTEKILKQVPKNLFDVLDVNGTMEDFTVEVVEDDVMDAAEGKGVPGKCCSWLHKFLIRRSALTQSQYTDSMMRELMTHELGHSLFPNNYDSSVKTLPLSQALPYKVSNRLTGSKSNLTESRFDYFLTDYLADVVKKAKTARQLPALDIYSLGDVGEFLAECTVAYLTGEIDDEPYVSITGGSLSRAELREKLPEVYLALKLFFEADSPCFGDLDLFSKKSKTIYDAILASDKANLYLNKNTHAADLADAYDLVDYYGKLPDEHT